MHGRKEEREAEDDDNRGSTGVRRKERCEANKMMGVVAVGGEELRVDWWYSTNQGWKKWQLKGCKKERSRWGRKLGIERNALRRGRWGRWVYAVGRGKQRWTW